LAPKNTISSFPSRRQQEVKYWNILKFSGENGDRQ
jgi:hypothetical protein